MQVLAIAVGGAVGAAARYGVARLARTYLHPQLPYGTLLVNVAGSLVLGLLVGLVGAGARIPPLVLALVGTGFCGAFTTFSTFATETLGAPNLAVTLGNLLANNVLALSAAGLGMWVGHALGS